MTSESPSADLVADQFTGVFPWNGDLSELVIYNRVLTAAERGAVEGYLMRKHRPETASAVAPVIEPPAGTFTGTVTVSMTSPTTGGEVWYTLDGSEPVAGSGTAVRYTAPFVVDRTTTVRARTVAAGIAPSAISAATYLHGADSDPADISGLSLWLRADAGLAMGGGDTVERWEDQSGRRDAQGAVLVATQLAGNKQPRLTADVSGHPTVRFDGANDVLNLPERLTNIRTAFWVIRKEPLYNGVADGLNRALLGDTAGSTQHFYGSNTKLWACNSTQALCADGARQIWVNGAPVDVKTALWPTGVSVVSVLSPATNMVADNLSDGAYTWNGDVAELVVYERPLNAAERQSVEEYLLRKYRPELAVAGAPAITPAGGTLTGPTTVTMTSRTLGAAIWYTLDGTVPEPGIGTSQQYTGAFTVASTTTIKARSFATGLAASAASVVTFVDRAEFEPLDVTGLAVWLRADAGIATDAGAGVERWEDQSGAVDGNGQPLAATQFALHRQPALAGDDGGRRVLRFDGVDDMVRLPSRLTNIRTVFWVMRRQTGDTTPRSLLGDTTSLRHFEGTATKVLSCPADQGLCADGVRQLWIDGVPQPTKTATWPAGTSVVTFASPATDMTAENFATTFTGSYHWNGDLAELIIYTRPLTPVERRGVEDYLLRKYRLQTPAADAPGVTPDGGEITEPTTVTLSTRTPGAAIWYTLDGTEPTENGATSIAYTGAFVVDETLTVKARAVAADFAPSEVSVASFIDASGFTPKDVSGLKLWLRADAGLPASGGTWAERWTDQSGAVDGQGAPVAGTQLATHRQGRVVLDASGRRFVRFDGADDNLLLPQRFTTMRTVFWVVRKEPLLGGSADTLPRALLGDTSNTSYFQGTATKIFACNANQASCTTGARQLWVNGAAQTTSIAPWPSGVSVITILSPSTDMIAATFSSPYNVTANYHWNGDLGELIVYDRALTTTERQEVEQYLLSRWQ